jgi:hypothetical protein
LDDFVEMLERNIASGGCDTGIQIKFYNNLKRYNQAKCEK